MPETSEPRVEKSGVRVRYTRTVILRCALCDAALTVDDVSGPRAARKAAEDLHAWVGVGPGGFDMVCPAHDIPCPHCDRLMSRDVALSARRTIRARQRQREADWREAHQDALNA